MAREYSSAQAKSLLSEYRALEASLTHAVSVVQELRPVIRDAADQYLAQEGLRILEGVPVEELNKYKEGFRTGVLRDNGYETLADIWTSTVYQLSSIYGISEDQAYRIKERTTEYLRNATAAAKLRLSEDRKDFASTKLVEALAKYRNSEESAWACQKLLDFEPEKRQLSKEQIQPLINGFSWLFASNTKKERANTAYRNLEKLVEGQFGAAARKAARTVEAAQQITIADAWDDFRANSVAYYTLLGRIIPGILGSQDSVYGLPEELAKEIQEECFFPDGLKCELRPYQVWGVKYILHQEKVLLGDEMGLGKTVQAIAAMVSLRNTGATHFMVVCPASVIANWTKEIAKHSKLRPVQVYGSSRNSALASWKKTGGVAVTTYETTSSIKLEDSFRFSLLTVDEAHYIKNHETRRSISVRDLCSHADRLLFMTGTALENKVDEMISLIKVLQPVVASQVSSIAFMSSAPQFREQVAPVYYRRKREDVLTELPDKIENEEWCTMNSEEERVYEDAVLSKNYAMARRVSWNVDDMRYSSKATRMLELISEAQDEGRKIIVFTFFLETARRIRAMLGTRCMDPINGSVPPKRRQEIIDQFDKAPAGSVLVCQIQSGGTGLNIQSASVVIICEPQFKPSIENQAISRAYRMGQTRNVLVYRLLCVNSVDEKIMEMLEEKQAIFDAFADKSAAAAAQENLVLDDKNFGEIINEEIERIKKKRGESVDHNTRDGSLC